MRVYLELLKKRQKESPVNVAIIGAGWFGKGLEENQGLRAIAQM